MTRDRLPSLDELRVAAPCPADWAAMSGDARVRHCGACKRNVYDLSELTRAEAEALILEKEGRLCVRFYRRADGTILFGNCAVGVWRRRRRVLVSAVVAFVFGLSLIPRRAPEPAPRPAMSGKPWVPDYSGLTATMGVLPPRDERKATNLPGDP